VIVMTVPIASKAVGGFSIGFGFDEGNGEGALILLLFGRPFVVFENKTVFMEYLSPSRDLYRLATDVLHDPVAEMLVLLFDLE